MIDMNMTRREVQELIGFLSKHNKDRSRIVSIQEIKSLIGCQIYYVAMEKLYDYGTVESILGTTNTNVSILAKHPEGENMSNRFEEMRYYPEYSLYADWDYSRWIFVLPVNGICRDCINSCKVEDKELCDLMELRTQHE